MRDLFNRSSVVLRKYEIFAPEHPRAKMFRFFNWNMCRICHRFTLACVTSKSSSAAGHWCLLWQDSAWKSKDSWTGRMFCSLSYSLSFLFLFDSFYFPPFFTLFPVNRISYFSALSISSFVFAYEPDQLFLNVEYFVVFACEPRQIFLSVEYFICCFCLC